MSKILFEKGFLSKIRPSFASACVRPSELEAWEQVYRKDKMAAYGGEGNLISLVL